MSLLKTFLTFCCCASILGAQAPVDLNSLAAAASNYASAGLQASRYPATLDLRILRGDNGGDPTTLMARAADVQRWTVFYNATYKQPVIEPIVLPKSASVKCIRGIFSGFEMANPAVPDAKTLDNTWLAVTLDGAIAQLNANGYVRGFSRVETVRPDLKGYPDELVYAFTCPWERAVVGISANTGALVWFRMF